MLWWNAAGGGVAYLPASEAEESEFVLMEAEKRVTVAHADASDAGVRQRCRARVRL